MKGFQSLLLALLFLVGMAMSQDKSSHAFDLYQAGDYEGAVKELTPVVAAEEDSPDWYSAVGLLAASYTHLGKTSEAHSLFQQLVDHAKTFGPNKPAEVKKAAKTAASDTAPLPVGSKRLHILKKPLFKLPSGVRSLSGTIWLAVEFRADSTIGFIVPIDSISIELVKPAIEAASKITFEPEVRAGKSVSVQKLITYGFWD
jgi:hypothetical protein